MHDEIERTMVAQRWFDALVAERQAAKPVAYLNEAPVMTIEDFESTLKEISTCP